MKSRSELHPDESSSEPRRQRTCMVAALIVAAAGAGLRLAAARGDLWLDEIWSLGMAQQAQSALGVFTRLHHDNNHYLNTLYLLLLGSDRSSIAYRLLSVAAGAGTLALASVGLPRKDRVQALSFLVLVAFCYLLVHYSSEARGYGPAVLFALACFRLLDAYRATPRPLWAFLFCGSAVLGLLSHLTFAYALVGFSAWASVELFQTRATRKPGAVAVASLGLPFIALGLLWLVDLRRMAIGGGPEYGTIEVVREAIRATFGTPYGIWEVLALPLLAGAGYEIVRMARERDAKWIFFSVALLLGPAALVWRRPEYLAARYFILSIPFLLMLVSLFLGRCFRQGAAGRLLCTAVLALFCIGNSWKIARLESLGRGSYREALSFLLEQTPAGPVTLGGDNDWRTGVLLGFYGRKIARGDRFVYLTADQWSGRAPLWVLAHDFDEAPRPAPEFLAPTGRRYTLAKAFPYAGLSGWNWYAYRLADPKSRLPGPGSGG